MNAPETYMLLVNRLAESKNRVRLQLIHTFPLQVLEDDRPAGLDDGLRY